MVRRRRRRLAWSRSNVWMARRSSRSGREARVAPSPRPSPPNVAWGGGGSSFEAWWGGGVIGMAFTPSPPTTKSLGERVGVRGGFGMSVIVGEGANAPPHPNPLPQAGLGGEGVRSSRRCAAAATVAAACVGGFHDVRVHRARFFHHFQRVQVEPAE